MYINKISVNNNLSFKGEFDDFLKLYRKFYTFTSWNIYGKRHSKKLVEKFMKEESGCDLCDCVDVGCSRVFKLYS